MCRRFGALTTTDLADLDTTQVSGLTSGHAVIHALATTQINSLLRSTAARSAH